ncbi:MAG: FtsX-like permease family protein [Cytophagales bacterium]
MMLYLKLAWRNIWRNKRRTAITLASIFFAVILSSLMMSMKEGTYDNMIKTTAGDFTGFLQVHSKDYWDEKTIDYSFEPDDSLLNILKQFSDNDIFLPRLESFALSATREMTKGAMVIGIDPELERQYSQLDQRLSSGEYFNNEDRSILIGNGLADYLELKPNDTLILLGQGFQGVSAAGKYPVKGIVKFGSPELSKQLVFLPLNEAQRLFGAENLINNLVIKTETASRGVALAQVLKSEISEEYEIMHWKELFPELVDMIKTDRVEGYVFMFILYMVISFGIFGTMLMMMAERRHEFGVLIAVGMKRVKLALVVFIEVFIISVFGSIIGIIGAFPVSYYFVIFPIRYGEEVAKMAEEYGMEPVLYASMDPAIFIQQAVVIAIVAIIIGIYPFVKLLGTKAIDEMNS